MSYDIITVGGATVDAYVKSDIKQNSKFLLYPIGEKMIIDDLHFTTGGGGTNTAVAFSRLGLKTAYLGKLGSGKNAEIILADLKKERVDFIGTQDTKNNTGYSIILGNKKEERTILTHKGTNNDLKFSEINAKKLKTNWFYFSSMIETSFQTQLKLVEYAHKDNIKIAYNPSYYQTKRGERYIKPILKHTEILILNKEEAESLVGKKNTAKKILNIGPRIVCITNGDKGATAYTNSHKYTAYPHKIKCIERTGAGDAFASGFVYGIIVKNDIEFALSLGMTNAESVIQYPGAKNILLNLKQAMSIMKKMPVKIASK